MTTIAFIGLGIMGSPMAVNLTRAGFTVRGHTRTPSTSAPLVAAGGVHLESIADAVADAEVIALMLPDSPDVESVLTAEDGVFAHARPGALIIDFSTIAPDVAARLAARAESSGFAMLDAPVAGGEVGAVNAALSVMVGGSADAFDRARPIFEAVGKTVVHVGPSGSGQTVKAANQLIVAGHLQLLAEALVFLRAHDLDVSAALTALGGGMAGSTVMRQKASTMLAGDFTPGFRVDLHHKDLGIAVAAAREAGVAIPLGSAAAQFMASARACGAGQLDHSALLLAVERLSGGGGD